MTLLVINSGSSSVKLALFDSQLIRRLIDIRIVEIGTPNATLVSTNKRELIDCDSHKRAFLLLFSELKANAINYADISIVGHRVTHGGDRLLHPTVINDAVVETINSLTKLAPLHNTNCLTGIYCARTQLPHSRHVAVFDTAFHATQPERATRYALPQHLHSEYPIRRYGFHGISHQFVAQQVRDYLHVDSLAARIVTCHLGSGCSVAAIENFKSVETSMGMTPLEGLVMGSRCGDIDAGIIIYLMREHSYTTEQVNHLLNKRSGFIGLTGTGDMSEIESRAHNGDHSCQLAIDIFTHRIRKYIGAYAAVMGGIDVIVFTGGIGENSSLVREQVMKKFDYLGARINLTLNEHAKPGSANPVIDVSNENSNVKILVVATDEETEIARQVLVM